MSSPTVPELLTPSEAAAHLKVSKVTVYREVARRLLGCHYVGAQLRFTAADLAEYLERTRQTPGDLRHEHRRRARRR